MMMTVIMMEICLLLVLEFSFLPDMPILGSSNSAANKDKMSKLWTNGDTIF